MDTIKVYIYPAPIGSNQFNRNVSRTNNSDQLGANLRVVALSGTAVLGYYYDYSNLETLIKSWLVSYGFIVNRVTVSATSMFNNGVNIELELNAYDSYSAEEVRVSAQNVLSVITGTYLFQTYNVLTDIYLRVITDYKTTTTTYPNNGNTNTNPKTTSSGVTNNYTYLPSVNDITPNGGVVDTFFKSLGSSLGVSSPLVIGGIIVLGIFILRR